ncbi:MAG: DUF6476 family protein [Pikeienuella sp.]
MPSVDTPLSKSEWTEPPQLRNLRRMVSVLTATLIIGVLAIVATLVIRIMMEEPAGAPAAIGAEAISLPAGEAITAIGATANALSVATRDADGAERIRVFHPETGEELSMTAVTRP